MKLVFPNGERDQVELKPGDNVVGSSDQANIVLNVNGIADLHATINLSEQGALIGVKDVTNITRVNGQLVAARTPIKAGDALLFANVQCQVVGEGPDITGRQQAVGSALDSSQTRVRMAVPTFTLRGVSGKTFGKTYPIFGTAVIGRHSECDICLPSEEISRHHAKIEVTSDGLFVEDLGSANGTFVNGKRVRRAKLAAGNELMLDTVRFLLQSPGMDSSPKASKPKAAAKPAAPAPAATAKPRQGSPLVKWVVIGTVLVAAAVAGLKLSGVL